MAKVDIELVKLILKRADLDARKIADIIEDINFEVKQSDDVEKVPPVKKQYVMVVSDPNGRFKDNDYVGWVVQIPEDESPSTVVEKLHASASDFNQSPKGQRLKVRSIAELCEHASSKIFKEHKLWVKNKEPVLIIPTKNAISAK